MEEEHKELIYNYFPNMKVRGCSLVFSSVRAYIRIEACVFKSFLTNWCIALNLSQLPLVFHLIVKNGFFAATILGRIMTL